MDQVQEIDEEDMFRNVKTKVDEKEVRKLLYKYSKSGDLDSFI